jgi:glycosyltransferase involved in cell wall biosynthesis
MRILHISTRLILGGSQENTVLSCEGQSRLGHEVHLAYGPIYGPEGSMLDRVQRFRTPDGRGITTHEVPHMVREVNPWADMKCQRELRALVRRLAPDIVHTHSSKAGILGRRAAWAEGLYFRRHCVGFAGYEQRAMAGRPTIGVVHTIHGPPFMPVEGGALKQAKRRAMNLAYTLAERSAARRCHVIASVAQAMTDQFLARGIGRREQYATVYSGMEVQPFLDPAPGESRAEIRATLGLADGDLVIGTVARLAEHKGHDDVLDALGDDLKTRPRWKLLWVGDGWWRERLMARVSAMGIEGQVVTTGLVPQERIPGLMRAMDLLVHPSYREGLPRTVPQALLAGVCPVAYDVDGTREACIEMETGRLVAVGDRAGLRATVEWLAEHPQEREAMALRGQEMCRQRFDADHMVQELELVYARALQAR